jgi:hypothetical protein
MGLFWNSNNFCVVASKSGCPRLVKISFWFKKVVPPKYKFY